MSKPIISSKSYSARRALDEAQPLPLPSGVDARSLRWLPLRRELERILGPIDPQLGKSDLLRIWGDHLEAAAAAGVEAALQAALERGAA